MSKIERNNDIVRMRAQGASVADIAATKAIPPTTVRGILNSHSFCITDRDPPAGLSVRNAWRINQALGIWPSPENAEEIRSQKIPFLRAPGTRSIHWKEIETWIDTVAAKT
jgi:hypothetical protein